MGLEPAHLDTELYDLVGHSLQDHSLRNVTAGSSLAARRAGANEPSMAPAMNTAVTPANVAGSCGVTPNRRLPTYRVSAAADTSPMTMPRAVTMTPWPTIRRKTCAAVAPSASRSPISPAR